MKNLSVAAFFLSLVLFSCSSKNKVDITKKIQVRENKNLEVLFSVYNQIWTPFLDEEASEFMLENTKLMKMNHEYFKEYSDHEVFSASKKFLNKSGTDFFLYAFYYTDFPNPKRKYELPLLLTKDINPDKELALQEIDRIMHFTADFYKKSKFEQFYKSNKYVYQLAKSEIEKNLPEGDFIGFLESYFGTSFTEYHFYCVPFFKSEFGIAHELLTEDNRVNLTFISPFEPAVINGNNLTYTGYDNKEALSEWVIHEYSHSYFLKSLKHKENLDKLNQYEYLYKTTENNPQIGNWFSMFNEHVAVAFEIRAAEILGDDRKQLILEKHNNWHYLDHFIKQLEFYENHRNIYKNIDDFIPVLIDSCKEL